MIRFSRLPARRVLLLTVAALAALLAAGCGQLSLKERELVFDARPGPARWFDGLPQDVRDLSIPVASPGGPPQHLHAWWWPAADAAAPAVLYLHGSRWNLTGQLFRIEQLHAFGFSVLAIDYRGFGQSEGSLPSEQTVYEDARAAWQRLAQLQPDAGRRFIYGHSLGSAVAVDLATRLDAPEHTLPSARGLIIESSFTNLADIAHALTSSLLPVQWLLSEKFDSLDKIASVRMPVLLVHGTADRFVPVRFSQALYDAAQSPKKLLLVEGGTHNNSMRLAGAAYREALHEAFGLDLPAAAGGKPAYSLR